MPQGLNSGRPWLALVVCAFCLPLFLGLGRTDLQGDEAIYSFAVDRILEVGDWLAPRSSPSETAIFLEKPPLKFWIVAAPIKLGFLPHTEFGLRFWDALFAAAAFLYVFGIGCRLAGPVCGVVAVLVLFVHEPLIFEHGLRSNNMEAALLLAYCGGVFHFLCWASEARPRRARLHAAAVGLLFVLGFMTKFVAVIFLPVVLGMAGLAVGGCRERLLRAWRLWLGVAGLSLGLIAPWFVYSTVRFGPLLWETILGEHVLTRFTASLNPDHVEPWSYYIQKAAQAATASHAALLTATGLALLFVMTLRRRSLEGTVVLLWLIVPLTAISLGTSKLYHYMYPFLPPLGLAAGYLAALALALAPSPLRRALERAEDRLAVARSFRPGVLGRGRVRGLLQVVCWMAFLLGAWTIIDGPLRIRLAPDVAIRNSGIWRVVVVLLLIGVFTRSSGRSSRMVVLLLLFSALPVGAYRETARRLPLEKHPIRTVRDCVVAVQTRESTLPRGLHVDIPDGALDHPIYYYLRRLQPWTELQSPSAPVIARDLLEPASWRPVLIGNERYQAMAEGGTFARDGRRVSPPMATVADLLLLLPGPYAACSVDARLQGTS